MSYFNLKKTVAVGLSFFKTALTAQILLLKTETQHDEEWPGALNIKLFLKAYMGDSLMSVPVHKWQMNYEDVLIWWCANKQ